MASFFTRIPTSSALTVLFKNGKCVADFPLGTVLQTAQPADVAGFTTLKVNTIVAMVTAGTVVDPATQGQVAGATLTLQGSDPLIPFAQSVSLPFQPVNV
jgi:hypothetical protein